MKRKRPPKWCEGCKSLNGGRFGPRCAECKNRYTTSKASGTTLYGYKGMQYTVPEYARIIGCGKRALYYQLGRHGSIESAVNAMRGKEIFNARLGIALKNWQTNLSR